MAFVPDATSASIISGLTAGSRLVSAGRNNAIASSGAPEANASRARPIGEAGTISGAPGRLPAMAVAETEDETEGPEAGGDGEGRPDGAAAAPGGGTIAADAAGRANPAAGAWETAAPRADGADEGDPRGTVAPVGGAARVREAGVRATPGGDFKATGTGLGRIPSRKIIWCSASGCPR